MLEVSPVSLALVSDPLQGETEKENKHVEIREISTTSNFLLRSNSKEDLREFLGRHDTKETKEMGNITSPSDDLTQDIQSEVVNCSDSDDSFGDKLDKLSKSLKNWENGEEKVVNLMNLLPKKNVQDLRNLVCGLIEQDIKSVESLRIQQERLKRGGKVA